MRTGRQRDLLWMFLRSSTSRMGGRLIPEPSAPAPNAASALSPARAIPSRGDAGLMAPTMRWNSSTRCRAGTAIGSARTRRWAAARRPRKRWCRWPDRRSAQEKARLRWLTGVPPGSPDGGGAQYCSEMASPRDACPSSTPVPARPEMPILQPLLAAYVATPVPDYPVASRSIPQ